MTSWAADKFKRRGRNGDSDNYLLKSQSVEFISCEANFPTTEVPQVAATAQAVADLKGALTP
jgi:hypothetical protein